MPGVVNSAEGRLDTLPSYGWRDKAVRADVASMTGYSGPISVENNACARAYGLRLLQKDLLMDVHNFTYFLSLAASPVLCFWILGMSLGPLSVPVK